MIDNYGRSITYLRLSVTDRCNYRCRYCMPEEGICKKEHDEMLTEDEMVNAVRAAASLGIRKLRITGGEPLVKKNILSLCERCKQVEGIEELAITTNGSLLPQLAEELHRVGVDRVNISLDTLDEEKFSYITRIGHLSEATAGIEAALAAGFCKVKVNVVLVGGFNDNEIERLAQLTVEKPIDVRFIELMPIGGNYGMERGAYIPNTEVLRRLPELTALPPDGGVATLYRLPNGKGNIGLISPVNAHFCASCNRLRLTADGKLKPCLHSAAEFPLKGLDLEGMTEVMRSAILAKPQWHGVLSYDERSRSQRGMSQIGG